MKRNRHRPLIRVIADGRDIAGHAGSRLRGDLADVLGLTDSLSRAAPAKWRRREHDRGEVLVDLAVMVAGGGEAISDRAVKRNQPRPFGEVASDPTAWRSLQAIDEDALAAIASARAAARATAREPGADPVSYVIDIDATVVTSHSDKQGAAPNKHGYGFHPHVAYLDTTGEALAGCSVGQCGAKHGEGPPRRAGPGARPPLGSKRPRGDRARRLGRTDTRLLGPLRRTRGPTHRRP